MPNDQSNDRSGFSAGLLLGLVAGAAAGYFFTTDKGKEVLEKLEIKAEDIIGNLKENESVQDKIQRAQDAVEQARKIVNEKATQVKESTEDKPKRQFFKRDGNSLK